MQSVQRAVARSTRSFKPQVQRQARRHASDSHGHTHDAHPTPKNESLGAGFYVALAALPASIAIYRFTQQGTSEQAYFTRLIKDTYGGWKAQWADRNDLHTQMIEQAAADRVLFLNETNSNVRHIELRYPEQFNGGSPWNVPAGHGSINLDKVIAKYEKEASEAQEKKVQQLRDNKVPAEQPLEPLVKATPGTAA